MVFVCIFDKLLVQPQAVFITGPIVAYEGNAVNYTCVTPRANPAASLYWLGVTSDIVQQYYQPTITILDEEQTFRTELAITILPTATYKTINVTCEAQHVSTTPTALRNALVVTVYLKPTVVLMTASIENVRITSDYSIDYNVTSRIEFNVTWWHESPFGSGIRTQVIGNSIKHVIWKRTASVATLTIRDYQTSDDGGYYPIVANYAGFSAMPIGSNVARTTGYAIPTTPQIITFNSYPVDITNVLMNCTSSKGVPNTEIRWYRNTQVVDSSWTTVGDISFNSYNHLAVFADKGAIFKCEASNIFGNTSTSLSFVDVYGKIFLTIFVCPILIDF
ncbi:uncharacterized protein LOC117340208 [Pecten maximus]|uniref:uncharacterized protein LOC117340208 n=1 Tax=Pecten maximus TaxID=6579 RepID=UPI00145829DD|nr:uncharacterized protein LOC117340208 [Pecten maximus]